MRVLFVQPSIPLYRVPFFNSLSSEFGTVFKVLYSEGDLGKLTPSHQYTWSKCIGRSIKIGFGLLWQKNLVNYKIKKNDIVIVPGNPRYISTLIFVLKVRFSGGKIAWWSHYRSSTSKTWSMFLRLKLMKIANGIIFYTQDEVKEYLSIKKQNKEISIVGLNNGIDINTIKDVRKNYDACLRHREILFIGRTSEKSNFNILLEAFNHPSLNNLTLNVIGNDKSYSYIKEVQSDLVRKPKINWYGILTNEEEISMVANKCQIFVYPGAVGLSLIHAMAYGLPCLVHSNRLLHMPEIAAFQRGKTGLTFQPNDSRDLGIKLSAMIANPKSLNKMSENCLRIVENDFNTTKMALRFIKFIKELE
ncbi:MAG: hypothetical protein CL851_04035 [Crocinitomicaceae bacterium]|nr:hypothetical protein [Crocinitomicaceae bacterium]|tara:strand:+ start:2127 stop:3209 length:1083 start_codon:yes stop_codon:yes gene_type:complete